MVYTASCASPLGGIVLAADELGLTGLWFTGAKYFGAGLPASAAKAETPILEEARCWLEGYFTGQRPAALPPPERLAVPPRGMGHSADDPLWRNDDLWPDRAAAGRAARARAPVRAGCRRGGRAQPDLDPHPLPPGHRRKRQPDRLRRRHGKKARAPRIRARENLISFWGCRQERLHAVPMDNGLK